VYDGGWRLCTHAAGPPPMPAPSADDDTG
jgi:hypothetical protein